MPRKRQAKKQPRKQEEIDSDTNISMNSDDSDNDDNENNNQSDIESENDGIDDSDHSDQNSDNNENDGNNGSDDDNEMVIQTESRSHSQAQSPSPTIEKTKINKKSKTKRSKKNKPKTKEKVKKQNKKNHQSNTNKTKTTPKKQKQSKTTDNNSQTKQTATKATESPARSTSPSGTSKPLSTTAKSAFVKNNEKSIKILASKDSFIDVQPTMLTNINAITKSKFGFGQDARSIGNFHTQLNQNEVNLYSNMPKEAKTSMKNNIIKNKTIFDHSKHTTEIFLREATDMGSRTKYALSDYLGRVPRMQVKFLGQQHPYYLKRRCARMMGDAHNRVSMYVAFLWVWSVCCVHYKNVCPKTFWYNIDQVCTRVLCFFFLFVWIIIGVIAKKNEPLKTYKM